MDILGVGPLELLFILLIALIILGPKEMVKAGQTIGRFLRKIVTSSSWMAVQQTSRELRNLPNKLIRDAGLDDIRQQLRNEEKTMDDLNIKMLEDEQEQNSSYSDWITPPDETEESSIPSPPESNQDIDSGTEVDEK